MSIEYVYPLLDYNIKIFYNLSTSNVTQSVYKVMSIISNLYDPQAIVSVSPHRHIPNHPPLANLVQF